MVKNKSIAFILIFIFYLIIQITVFNNILFLQQYRVDIYVYPLIFFVDNRSVSNLLRAFFVGLVMDVFSNTMGVHAAACTLVVFLNNLLFNYRNRGQEQYADPSLEYLSIKNIGVKKFIMLYSILIFIHQAVIFLVDNWGNGNSIHIIYKMIVPTFFAFSIIFALNIIKLLSSNRGSI